MSFAPTVGRRSPLAFRSEARYVAATLLIGIALLLVVRRLAGALTVPLAPPTALACGLTIALLASIAELATSYRPANRYLPLVIAVAACAALTLRHTSTISLLLLWSPLVFGESWRRLRLAPTACSASATTTVRRMKQELTRFIEADGRDICRGTARAEFSSGQRSASIHLAFCPPFAVVPKMQIETTDESQATVKISQLLPYAARIDVKLSAPAAEPQDVEVTFSAVSP